MLKYGTILFYLVRLIHCYKTKNNSNSNNIEKRDTVVINNMVADSAFRAKHFKPTHKLSKLFGFNSIRLQKEKDPNFIIFTKIGIKHKIEIGKKVGFHLPHKTTKGTR